MPAALQCPDCGHQEMLDNLGGVTTFRCGGCGRALKVPSQFRGQPAAARPAPAPAAHPPVNPRSLDRSAGEPTQAMPKISSGLPPVVGGAVAGPAVAGPGLMPPIATGAGGLGGDGPTGRSPVAEAGGGAPVAIPPGSLHPPLILRLVLWLIALPLGSLVVFGIASSLKLLTKSQLEDTFLLAGWGRFMPVARLLPFCALVTALLVQLGVFGLERLRMRNLRARRQPPGGPGPSRRGAPRPSAPPPRSPARQPGTNGARSRDRAIS